jgi:DNA-binding transcriptional regulator YiaG
LTPTPKYSAALRPETPTPRKPKGARVSGKTVSRVREQLGLSIGDFADALGVHLSTIYRWEASAKAVVRAATVQLVFALNKRSSEDLRLLGNAIARACQAKDKLEASRLLLNTAAATEGE